MITVDQNVGRSNVRVCTGISQQLILMSGKELSSCRAWASGAERVLTFENVSLDRAFADDHKELQWLLNIPVSTHP